MRIARLVTSFPRGGLLTGGLLPNIYHLSTEEIRRGNETAVFTYGGDGPGPERVGDVPVYRCGRPRLQRLLLGPAILRTIRRTGFHPDIIHSMNAMPLGWLYDPSASRRVGARCVLSVHTPVRQTDRFAPTRRYAQNAEYALLLRRTSGKVDLNIAVSRFVMRELVAIGVPEDRIRVIPSGLNTDLFVPQPLSFSAPYHKFLYVGRFAAIKGLENLVKAAALLQQEKDCRNTRFVLVGGSRDDDDYSRTISLIAQYGLEHLFALYPPTPHREMPNFYKNCHCFVLPSIREPLGKVLLEAMASRRPVVASDAGGIPDLVQHDKNGLLFRSQDPSSLADALSRIMDDPKLALKMASRGVRFCKGFDWARISRMYLEAFEEVLRR